MLYTGILFIAIGTYLIHQSNRSKNSARINQLEDVLVGRNEKISEQSEIINANITGGNSYCFLEISPITSEDYMMVLLHEGDYTIKNVVVAITDEVKRVEEYLKLPRDGKIPGKNIIKGIEIVKKYTTEYKIGNMAPNIDGGGKAGYYNTHLGSLNFKDENVVYYFTITISADNGLFYQKFKSIILENGTRVVANILRNPKGEIIFDRSSKNYPRDDKNQLIW